MNKQIRKSLDKIKGDFEHSKKFGERSHRNLLNLLDVMVCEIEDMGREIKQLRSTSVEERER